MYSKVLSLDFSKSKSRWPLCAPSGMDRAPIPRMTHVNGHLFRIKKTSYFFKAP